MKQINGWEVGDEWVRHEDRDGVWVSLDCFTGDSVVSLWLHPSEVELLRDHLTTILDEL